MRSTGTEAIRPRYAAFISYSRAVDGHLAPALRDALQQFAKPWYRPRALRVFRDDAALAANPGLWSSIVEAMDHSEYFILLASPEAAASPWVNQEVGLRCSPGSRTQRPVRPTRDPAGRRALVTLAQTLVKVIGGRCRRREG